MDWRHRSACLDENPELFFPIGIGEPAMAQVEDARRVCARCEVKAPCLAWALDMGLDHGVLGGLTEGERRVLSRARTR